MKIDRCKSTEVYYSHSDHLGSSNWITDEWGEPVQYLQYLPYGELWMDIHTVDPARYTFSGKEKDEETGYHYFGARYYDSNLGIWLSMDPLSYLYPSTSPYAYCRNNPIMLIDPNGEFDTRAEARRYRRENKTGGRIKKYDTGDFSIENKKEKVSYHKDESLADYHGTTVGIDKGGVVKSPMVSASKNTRLEKAFTNTLSMLNFSFNWYYDNLGLGGLPAESPTYEKFGDLASTLATTIFIGGIKMDRDLFHKKYKQDILKKVGKSNFLKKSGKKSKYQC